MMRSVWTEPYLWVHLAGLATVPMLLAICLLGLAIADAVVPPGFTLIFVAIVGVLPIVWMQWQRPFYIFSLLAVALQPSQLSDDQRRLLTLFKTPLVRILTIVTAVGLVAVVWQLSHLIPLALNMVPFSWQGKSWGVLLAAIAFLGVNLFVQVPVSVLRVLFTSSAAVAAQTPMDAGAVLPTFTVVGWRVRQILPSMQLATPSKDGNFAQND